VFLKISFILNGLIFFVKLIFVPKYVCSGVATIEATEAAASVKFQDPGSDRL